jgi:type IV secretory pathway VirJ component
MKYILQFLFVLIFSDSFAQSSQLPVMEWKSASETPFIFYISGDGGLNSFSTSLCKEINDGSFHITALNAKSYFWDKKTPQQTANDISAYLDNAFAARKNQQLVIAGYSFGADVVPFIINSLPERVKKKLISVILLAPSRTTDFEIHILDMFGSASKRNMNVINEINKMNVPKLATIIGVEEDIFPVKEIKLPHYHNETLPGHHHFDKNTDEVAKAMIRCFR